MRANGALFLAPANARFARFIERTGADETSDQENSGQYEEENSGYASDGTAKDNR